MDEKRTNPFFTKGTPQCGMLLGVVGVLAALSFLTLGFWRTLLMAAFAAIGYYIGAVRNKSNAFRDTVNKVFPPKGE